MADSGILPKTLHSLLEEFVRDELLESLGLYPFYVMNHFSGINATRLKSIMDLFLERIFSCSIAFKFISVVGPK
jgi:hypothetical protein